MAERPGPVEALWNALHSHASPIVVVYCADLGLRERVIEVVAMLAELDWEVVRVQTVHALLQADPDAMVLLVPDDEAAAVSELAGARDMLVERQVPVVLVLLRGREGAQALAESVSLASWVRGNAVDPDALAEVDLDAERAAFQAELGLSPEAWLAGHRDTAAQDLAELSTTYRALLLEQTDVG